MIQLSEQVDWKLINVVGIELATGRNQTIELTNFPNGVYFLKTNTEIIRIVKQ